MRNISVLGVGPAGWSGLGAGRFLALAVDFTVSAYLMRVLGPNPFGLVAMADGLLVVVGSVGDAGIGASLVSDRDRSPSRVMAAYTMTFAVGGVVAGLMLLATPLVTALYGTEAVRTPWMVLATLFSIALIQSVSHALLQVERRFAMLGMLQLATAVIAGAAAVLVAQTHHDVWPILVRRVMASAAGLALLTLAAHPRLHWPRLSDITAITQFGAGVTGFNLLNALNRNADNILIGRFLGEGALGLYAFAYRVLLFPLGQLGGLVGTVAYPHLSRHLPDLRRAADELAGVMAGLGRAVTPAAVGVALVAPELISVVFGRQWMDAVGPFRVLALLAIYQTPYAQIGLAYTVSRRTGLMARWAVIATPVLLASFVLGLHWGILGVAVCYALASTALAPAMVGLAAKALGCPMRTLVLPALRAIGGSLLASIPLVLATVVLRALGSSPTVLLAEITLFGIATEVWVVSRALKPR